ncbi:hypothetical protein Tco_0347318, partial [Tanacetum coccineum]
GGNRHVSVVVKSSELSSGGQPRSSELSSGGQPRSSELRLLLRVY